jgi:hypothetical protein
MNAEQLKAAGWDEVKPGEWQKRGPSGFMAIKDMYHPKANAVLAKPKKRIRQSSKPLLNKLESEFLLQLKAWYPFTFHCQAIKFKIGNGVTFCPDIVCFNWNSHGSLAVWEVKGPHAWDDSIVKLKVFASTYPDIAVHLAWKDKKLGAFRVQDIKP